MFSGTFLFITKGFQPDYWFSLFFFFLLGIRIWMLAGWKFDVMESSGEAIVLYYLFIVVTMIKLYMYIYIVYAAHVFIR